MVYDTIALPLSYLGKSELVTVLGSNLRRLISDKLILQLEALKSHLGIQSFVKSYIKKPPETATKKE